VPVDHVSGHTSSSWSASCRPGASRSVILRLEFDAVCLDHVGADASGGFATLPARRSSNTRYLAPRGQVDTADPAHILFLCRADFVT
jgi:hypothetical protein